MQFSISAGGNPREAAGRVKDQAGESAKGKSAQTAYAIGDSIASYVRSFDDDDEVSVSVSVSVWSKKESAAADAAAAAATAAETATAEPVAQ